MLLHGYKCSLSFKNRGTMCEGSTSFEFFKCSLTGLSTLTSIFSFSFGFGRMKKGRRGLVSTRHLPNDLESFVHEEKGTWRENTKICALMMLLQYKLTKSEDSWMQKCSFHFVTHSHLEKLTVHLLGISGNIQSVGNYPSTCNLIRFLWLKNFFLVWHSTKRCTSLFAMNQATIPPSPLIYCNDRDLGAAVFPFKAITKRQEIHFVHWECQRISNLFCHGVFLRKCCPHTSGQHRMKQHLHSSLKGQYTYRMKPDTEN